MILTQQGRGCVTERWVDALTERWVGGWVHLCNAETLDVLYCVRVCLAQSPLPGIPLDVKYEAASCHAALHCTVLH